MRLEGGSQPFSYAWPMQDLPSHIDASGQARMVDVGDKPVSRRIATAECYVRINSALQAAIRANALAKGDLLSVARLAGIQAAKRTDELIPLCHSLPLDAVDVRLELLPDGRVHITASAHTHARTGVEMEALTAASVAALTVIDMGKSLDKSMTVENLRILHKSGGRSGEYNAPSPAPAP